MKIKVLSIITRNSKGGSSEFIINFLSKVDSKDIENILIYGGDKLNYSFKSIYIKELVRNINPLKDFVAFFRIFLFILNFKPDIIHTHTSKAGVLGRFAAFIYKLFLNRKLKIVHTPHGHVFYGYFSKPKSFLFLLVERLLSYITDVFIALSDNEKKESIDFGLGNYEKWLVIPSGIDYNIEIREYDLMKKFNIGDDDIVIGSVMRFEDVKGDKYFILAANEVLKNIKKNIRFVLVGDGTNNKIIKDMIISFDIFNYFIIPGWQKNVYDWINIMDIYIQPSLNEGLGRTVIMAELLKKPIIASSVCGLKDLVIDGYNGFLVKPKDYLLIADLILKLIFNKELRTKMGENSFRLVNEEIDGFKKYSFDRSIYLHNKLYIDLVK